MNVAHMKLSSKDMRGKYKLNVKIDWSMRKPVTPTEVIKTPNGWIFPEDVTFYNHHDKFLYAIGANHTWRSPDLENSEWELVV